MAEGIKSKRIWELDFARGIALILMVYFHLVYDMKEFFGYSISYEGNINFYIGKCSAILFILLSGISSSLSRSSIKRGLKVLGAALLITLASYIYNSSYFIVFGILHFLGLSMILSSAMRKLNKYILLGAGALIILLGFILPLDNAVTDIFMFIGFRSQTFASSDYYPFIPWYGIYLIGMALGKLVYSKKESLIKPFKGNKILSVAGQHTLIIYLLHQPLILLILQFINRRSS